MALDMGAIGTQRLSRREVLAALAASAPAFAAGSAAAGPATDWSESSHSALRLLDAGRADDGAHLAAIAIRLQPGFKTYWRHPGDSGVPPVFRFQDSQNLKEVEVRFPAPKRFDDGAGGIAFGYGGREVLLPVVATPVEPSKPVRLRLQADYAVCEKLCVLAQGAAELVLHGPPTVHADAVRQAMAAVPRLVRLGEGGGLGVVKIARGREPERFDVVVVHPGNAAPELFVEASPPWHFETGAYEPVGGGLGRIGVRMIARGPVAPDLTLTLVAGRDAVELRLPLDTGLIAP